MSTLACSSLTPSETGKSLVASSLSPQNEPCRYCIPVGEGRERKRKGNGKGGEGMDKGRGKREGEAEIEKGGLGEKAGLGKNPAQRMGYETQGMSNKLCTRTKRCSSIGTVRVLLHNQRHKSRPVNPTPLSGDRRCRPPPSPLPTCHLPLAVHAKGEAHREKWIRTARLISQPISIFRCISSWNKNVRCCCDL